MEGTQEVARRNPELGAKRLGGACGGGAVSKLRGPPESSGDAGSACM